MKYILILMLILIVVACAKELIINEKGLAGTWWFVPVKESHKTDFAQLHWNKDGNLFVWYTGTYEDKRPGYCNIIDNKVYWEEIINGVPTGEFSYLFTILKKTDIELTIKENNNKITLIKL
jgi:hypothetical protein